MKMTLREIVERITDNYLRSKIATAYEYYLEDDEKVTLEKIISDITERVCYCLEYQCKYLDVKKVVEVVVDMRKERIKTLQFYGGMK